MPVTDAYRPDPLYASLGDGFADIVRPAAFGAVRRRWRNQRWAAAVGLDGLDEPAWEAAFARFEPLPGNMPAPLAMRYHGHQFRVYNPDIGDGRGFLFAQLRDRAGRLLDLGTKGSGRTPWSRSGDGRLTLKGGVREILAAGLLEALGAPSSKAFALFETDEQLERQDEPSPTRAAVLTRLQHSHIRIGTFQRLAYFEDGDRMRRLIAHCGAAYHPSVDEAAEADQPAAFLQAVIAATARLAGAWMAAGFVHGVLNTDNFNITGESFDYGPWRFLPASDPNFTAAYFDHAGLYRFARQPEQAGWTLAQLASALTLIAPQAQLAEALERFPALYREGLRAAMFRRLGLAPGELETDLLALQDFFAWMTETGAGWAQTMHDWFCGEASAARALEGPQGALYKAPAFAPIRAGLLARPPLRAERLAHPLFARPTPPDLLIAEVEALWAPIARDDDWAAFHAKIAEIDDLRAALGIGWESGRGDAAIAPAGPSQGPPSQERHAGPV